MNDTELINETLQEKDPEWITGEKEIPEAPASANMKVWIKGYGVQFTIRGSQVNNVVLKALKLIAVAEEKGWKNTWKDDETVEREKSLGNCPKCGEPLVEQETKKGTVIKCSTNKWNRTTKKAEGCSYVKWPENS